MRLLLYLVLLPILLDSVFGEDQLPSAYDDTNHPSKHQVYNNLMNDAIICANGRHKNGIFTYEKCPRYPKTGYFPFCVYLVIPSSDKKQGHDAYGCVYAHRLPSECAEREEFYSPYETVFIRGKKHQGAMMCCMDNYCNQVEEPVFTMVRLKDDEMEGLTSTWPWLVGIITIVSCLIPVVFAILNSREANSMKRTEQPALLSSHIGIEKEMQKIPDVMEQSMKFPNLRKMQDIVRGTLQPSKYSTASTTNKEQKKEEEEEEFKFLVKKDELVVFQKDQELPRKLNRQMPSRYEHLAQRMIEHGPYHFDFDPVELGDLFDSVAQLVSQEPPLLVLQPEIDVYGNLEGSYGDLFRWMHKNGWPPKRKVLFLGGLSGENEPYSLETVALIFAMKKLMPRHVYILRGATEVYPISTETRRFTNRVTTSLAKVIDRAFAELPLAATVNGVFFSHGGLSPSISKMRHILDIKRPINEVEKGTVAADLIFSQAGDHNGAIAGSRGYEFTKEFQPHLHLPDLAKHEVELFVRSRNPSIDGFMYINEKILSIWSAPGSPTENRAGCSLTFNHNMEMTVNQMGVYGTFDQEAIKMNQEKLTKKKATERRDRKMKRLKENALKVSKEKESEKKKGNETGTDKSKGTKQSESSGKETGKKAVGKENKENDKKKNGSKDKKAEGKNKK